MIFNSLVEGMAFVENFSKEYQIDEPHAYKLNLIAEELITNIFKHTDAQEYELIVKQKEHIYLQINYLSPYFNSAIQKPQSKDVKDLPYGGLGLFLVKKMALEFHHSYKDGRNIFELTL